MKKIIITVLSAVLLICLFPMSASAEETLKAPTVQYKLINHDEIALRWTEVEGADGYCVYRADVETGKTVRYREIVKDTAFNATGLKQATDYVFKVAAVSENDNQITIGKKSKGTALTTPDEWYYYFESSKDSHFYKDDLDGAVMMRKHYDNTGSEVFNMVHINKAANEEASDRYDGTIQYRNPINIDRYVYFEFYAIMSEDDAITYLCRMKNDGSDFEIVGSTWYDNDFKICMDWENNKEYVYVIRNDNDGLWDLEDEDYEIICEIIKDLNYFNDDPDNIYKEMSEYQENTDIDLRWLYDHIRQCESDIEMLYYDKDEKVNYKELYSGERTVLSGPVGDDKYIYFLTEPLYNITDKTDTVIYRAEYDGTDLQKIKTLPKDNSFIYGSMELFDCDGEYLYYYVCGKKASEINRNLYYTFYRININEKSAVPQKIISVDDLSLPYNRSVELCNGYLYIKTYTYDKNYNEVPIYICIRADGKGLKKQDEPFEWRY